VDYPSDTNLPASSIRGALLARRIQGVHQSPGFLDSWCGVPLDDKIVLWTNLPLVWVALPPFTVLGIINIYMTVWIPVFWITNGPLHLGAGLKW